jgi:hypothetical protein
MATFARSPRPPLMRGRREMHRRTATRPPIMQGRQARWSCIWCDRSVTPIIFSRTKNHSLRKMMGAMMAFMNLGRDEDDCISEELLARLHNATEESVLALVATFRDDDRARLAHLCYRKTHLRPIGLAIGSTCGLSVLVNELGPGLGRAIFDQSRDHTKEAKRAVGRMRPAITLASSAGRSFPSPVESDEVSALEDGLPVPNLVE